MNCPFHNMTCLISLDFSLDIAKETVIAKNFKHQSYLWLNHGLSSKSSFCVSQKNEHKQNNTEGQHFQFQRSIMKPFITKRQQSSLSIHKSLLGIKLMATDIILLKHQAHLDVCASITHACLKMTSHLHSSSFILVLFWDIIYLTNSTEIQCFFETSIQLISVIDLFVCNRSIDRT